MDCVIRVFMDAVLPMALAGISSVQVSSLTWTPAIKWGDAYDELEDLADIRFAFEGNSYEVWFQIAVFTVLCYIAYGVFTFTAGEMCCDGVDELVWGTIGMEVLYGIGFVPLFSTLIDVFNCIDGYVYRDHSIECSTGKHTAYSVLSALAITLLFLGFLLTSKMKEYDRSKMYDQFGGVQFCSMTCFADKEPRRNLMSYRRDLYLEPKYIAFRAISCILALMLNRDSQDTKVTGAVLLAIVGCLPPAYIIWVLPHHDNKVNIFKVGLYTGTWTSFVAALIVTVNDDAENDQGAEFLACYPLLVVIGMFLCFVRIKIHDPHAGKSAEQQPNEGSWDAASTDNMAVHVKRVGEQPPVVEIRLTTSRGLHDLYLALASDTRNLPEVTHLSITADNGEDFGSQSSSATSFDVEAGPDPPRSSCCSKREQPLVTAAAIPDDVVHLKGVPLLIAALDAKTTRAANLQEVTVTGFNLKDSQHAMALAQALAKKPLRVLDLWRNRLGDVNCIEIGKILHECPSLTSINLGSNGMTATGKDQLAGVFKDRKAVELQTY